MVTFFKVRPKQSSRSDMGLLWRTFGLTNQLCRRHAFEVPLVWPIGAVTGSPVSDIEETDSRPSGYTAQS